MKKEHSSTMVRSVGITRDRLAPATARRAIEELDDLDPDLIFDARLLVSELVTNSVKYGADRDVSLRVRSDHPWHVHVEVFDEGDGFVPEARHRPATDVGGWGLYLVGTLADRWGVNERSARVWFEIDRA